MTIICVQLLGTTLQYWHKLYVWSVRVIGCWHATTSSGMLRLMTGRPLWCVRLGYCVTEQFYIYIYVIIILHTIAIPVLCISFFCSIFQMYFVSCVAFLNIRFIVNKLRHVCYCSQTGYHKLFLICNVTVIVCNHIASATQILFGINISNNSGWIIDANSLNHSLRKFKKLGSPTCRSRKHEVCTIVSRWTHKPK